MTAPTRLRFLNALLLGLLCGLLAVFAKGFLLGLEQTDAGWGWLSVPVDTISAPVLLVSDFMMVASGQFDRLVALPWMIWGILIGTTIGFFDRD